MGNLCSAVRRVFDYALSFILPRCTPYFRDSYMYILDESFASFEDADDILEQSFPNGDELVSVESQNCERDNEETPVNNTRLLQDIISNFFSNCNFQMKVMNGKVFEKNFINDNDSFGCKQLKWSLRQEDLVPGLEQVRINEASVNPKCEEDADSLYIYDQNQENNPQELIADIENLVKENSTVESNKSSPGYRQRNYGSTQKGETCTKRGQLQQNLSESSSTVEKKNYANQISDDRNRRKLVSGHNLRKLSLLHLHSGCDFLEEESNADVKLANYSFESVPLRIHIDNFRSMSHLNLHSGGRVSFEELSEYLCVPNYYAENPIVPNEIPEGVECPASSTMEIPLQQATLRPTSCSGGGIVQDYSRRVSLPDIFPERNLLLHPVLPQKNTQSSMSSGQLVTTEEDQRLIFSDLLFQSRKCDNRSPTQVVGGEEDPDQALEKNSSPRV